MIDEIAFKKWFTHMSAVVPKVRDVSVFVSIMTADYEKEPQCAFEFGLAVLMDKPIYILAPFGTKIPENVKHLARGLCLFKTQEEMKEAAARFIKEFKEFSEGPNK